MSKKIILIILALWPLLNNLYAQDAYTIEDTKLKKLGKTVDIRTKLEKEESLSGFSKITRKINKKRPENFKNRNNKNH